MKKRFDKSILATLILIGFICACFSLVSFEVNRMATESCFNTLDDATAQVAATLRAQVRSDREHLDVIADLLAQHEEQDPETVLRHLRSFRRRGTLTSVGLLLPDGHLILGAGNAPTVEAVFDYSAELARVPYTSGVVDVPGGSGVKIFYQAVPVERDGQNLGILYGFVDLADFAASITVTAFDGSAQIYVADGETGDLLVDTWHDKLGNIFDEDILSRKVKRGYDFHEMKVDFVEGRSGHIAFLSRSAGEYFYSCYMPTGINRWMVQLTVPESVVFANAMHIRRVLYFVAAAEVLSFGAYFLWVIARVCKDAAQKEQRLAQSLYMYDVQQVLFDAHKDPASFTDALRKVSDMLTADTSFFLALEGANVKESFFSARPGTTPERYLDADMLGLSFSETLRHLATGKNLLLYPEDIQTATGQQAREELARRQITNLMLVPVLDSRRELVGILGSANMKRHWTDCSLLECVARNFLMALSNMRFHLQIEQMGIIDALTGLRNRNCYECSLGDYGEKGEDTALCCLYIDANGLHELNNTLGHTAGDAMLVCISDTLRALFPPQDCYRIGGDEFVVFAADCSKEEIQRRTACLNQRVEDAGYHISIGEAWFDSALGMTGMVTEAEQSMYEAKHLYYQKAGDLSKARLMNQKLERILLEKQDKDTFLDVIGSRFIGVYVVNTKTDLARSIYKPSYFADILEEHHYCFIPSMQAYCRSFVADGSQADFLARLNYDDIRRQLEARNVINYHYQKKDGKKLVLRIYPARDYGPGHDEVIWLFEEDSN